jgi:ubiquinone/menaquinone biosynthesis C-methylase UbiE
MTTIGTGFVMDNTYLTLEYNSKSRWLSYWYQISETMEDSPSNVLLIGKGSGITGNAIRQLSGSKTGVLTVDINNAVNPDVAGDVRLLPFASDSFDVAVCCQVLEHIPFNEFSTALRELHRVAKKRVIISLPHKRKHFKLSYHVPFLKERTIIIKHPFTVKHCKSKQHYWEICRGVSKKEVKKHLTRYFDIRKEFLNEINCTHRFFVLQRKNIR